MPRSCDHCLNFILDNIMTTISLPWTNIILATTELHAISGNHEKEVLQWHSEGTTLYIVMENREEIDMRLDMEVFDFQVRGMQELLSESNTIYQCEHPESANSRGFIFFKMMWNGPLAWASGTNFDPYYDDANQIAIQLDLDHEDDQENYGELINWIEGSIPGEVALLAHNDALELWQSLSGYTFKIVVHLPGPHRFHHLQYC
jgi:hypothetical protein